MFSKIFESNNPIFELARTGRWLPPVWLAVILAVVFIFGGQFIGAIPYVILLGLGWMPSTLTPIGSALYLLVFFAITLLPTGILLVLWLLLVEKRSIRTLGFEKPAALKKFLRGLAAGTILFTVVVLLIALPGYLNTRSQDSSLPVLIIAVLIALPGWILQSSLEEMVMRGWLMPVIGARKSTWLALLISSMIFALLHLLNPDVSLLSTVNIALAGLMFALLVLCEGGIWGACGLHSAWNWAQGSLFGFPVSGNLLQSPSLWMLVENGPDIITGGNFGPEGGVISTIVLLAACAVLGWLIHRRNSLTLIQ